MNSMHKTSFRHVRGFGLVEIMVGMVVGLISMLVIMQVYSVFEGQKRATTSGSDAQTNGALALYLMEREVRAAGNGMTEGEPQKYPPLAGCLTRVFHTAPYLTPNAVAPFISTLKAAGSSADVRFAPVIVSDGGGGLSDSLTVVYGSSSVTAPYTLSTAYVPGTINLTSAAGIDPKDMVALIDRDPNPALTVSGNYITPSRCSLLQVTAVSPAGVLTVTDSYSSQAYTDDARLYNLGQLSLVTYRVNSNNLVADSTKFGVIPDGGAGTAVVNRTDFSPLAANVVNMQVQYGVDTGNPNGPIQQSCKIDAPGTALTVADPDAIVDSWVDATGNWANNGSTLPSLFDLRRVRAIRIGLVARSGIKATGTADDPCNTAAPTIHWDSGPDMTPDLSSDTDWQCYRYKVFQSTIAVRNALWSGTMNPASSASCGLRNPN